jgi:hypothetical protein
MHCSSARSRCDARWRPSRSNGAPCRPAASSRTTTCSRAREPTARRRTSGCQSCSRRAGTRCSSTATCFPRHREDDRAGPAQGETAELALEDGPCPSCTSLLDQWDGAAPHAEPLINLVIAARAPLPHVLTFARERGWRYLTFVSCATNTYSLDYGAQGEDGSPVPILNVFHRDGDTIRHFWAAELMFVPTEPGQDPRALGPLEPVWNMLDLTPEGRRPDWDEQIQY